MAAAGGLDATLRCAYRRRMLLDPPKTIDSATLAFCAGISPEAPVYVPVRPMAEGKVAYCFDNSVAYAERNGGEAVYGWAIWHWPGRWFEAEHHAVWRSPAGELVDVTPQAGDPPRILFLPDPLAPYDPTTFRRNILVPEDGNEAAREYIALAHARTDITSTYWEPGLDVLPLFRWEDRQRLEPIEGRMAELRRTLRD